MSARVAILGFAAALAFCGVAAAQDSESLNPMRGIEKGTLDSFVELPLFDPARRLPPPPPPSQVVVEAPAPPPPEPPPSLQLVGIVHGQRDMAIVHQNGAEKAVILRNGESLGNWTVVVQPLGVTLRSGDRTVSYSIFAKPGGPAPVQQQQPLATSQMMRRAPDE